MLIDIASVLHSGFQWCPLLIDHCNNCFCNNCNCLHLFTSESETAKQNWWRWWHLTEYWFACENLVTFWGLPKHLAFSWFCSLNWFPKILWSGSIFLLVTIKWMVLTFNKKREPVKFLDYFKYWHWHFKYWQFDHLKNDGGGDNSHNNRLPQKM